MSDIRQRLQAQGARLPELTEDLRALDRLFDTDVQSALNKVRVVAVKVLYRLCTAHGVSWGSAEPTLERMLGPLVSSGVLPKHVAVHVRTVQAHANFGSHFQESPPSPAHLSIAVNALAEFLTWYEALSSSTDSGTPGRGVAPPPRRILVVEESLSNQRRAEAFLRKHGHTVVLAAGGDEALTAMARQDFDLILMQVQMEGIDGSEATARIRDLDRQRGRYTPILGMTSDPARRVRATAPGMGMDGAVSRPIDLPELLEAIERLDIDWRHGIHSAGGDESLFREAGAAFVEWCSGHLESIREALARQDASQLQHRAHSMKGNARVIGAWTAALAAERLERLAREKDLVRAEEAYASLARELDRARAALSRFLGSPGK
jgi:CheY-like chemotaxis protein